MITVAGLILLLDRLDEIDLDFGYGLPLLIAAVGAILLTAGLEGPAQTAPDGAKMAGMSASAAAPAAPRPGPRRRRRAWPPGSRAGSGSTR